MATATVKTAPEEEERAEEEKSTTRKDGMVMEEHPDGEVDVEEKPTPHGHNAVHDMHDFYGAGQETAHDHAAMADDEELKGLLNDHADQMESMSQELCDYHKKKYPDLEHPEPHNGMTEESEDMAEDEGGGEEEESETPGEEAEMEDEERQAPLEDDEEEEKKSRKSQSTRKSVDVALSRKKSNLLLSIVDDYDDVPELQDVILEACEKLQAE